MIDHKDFNLFVSAVAGDCAAQRECRERIMDSILRKDEMAEAVNKQIVIDLRAMQVFGLYTGDREVFDL